MILILLQSLNSAEDYCRFVPLKNHSDQTKQILKVGVHPKHIEVNFIHDSLNRYHHYLLGYP